MAVIWSSLSRITLAIWVRVGVRVTGDAHITRVLGMAPKRGCDTATLKREGDWGELTFAKTSGTRP